MFGKVLLECGGFPNLKLKNEKTDDDGRGDDVGCFDEWVFWR